MTIQWTLVATFLYLELFLIFLLLLPFISPKIWQYALYSRVFRVVSDKANVYFTVFIVVLIFFFLDSIREMINYSNQIPQTKELGQELQKNLKLFRSQRNYYISGFTVFLWLVIRRLIMLVLAEAELLDENESAMKRAQHATETVEKILRKKEEIDKEISFVAADKMIEINNLHKQIEETKNELENAKNFLEDMKEKSLAVSDEYKNLLKRHTALMEQSETKEEEEEEHTEESSSAST